MLLRKFTVWKEIASPLKTVAFAYHNMGIAGLEALQKHGFAIVAVFTHEDDPGENCWFDSVKSWAIKNNIAYYTAEDINTRQWIDKIAQLQPEIIFSFYYRKMISREILEIPALGAFNLHGSLLPAYRGRCPINWVLVNGEKNTGVTLHYMVEKPDAGDIVGQEKVEISFTDTAKTLYDKLCVAATRLLNELLPLFHSRQIPRTRQNLALGSYYGGRRPEDGRIDWNKSAQDIYNLIRGVTDPYPGAFSTADNGEKVIIWWGVPIESTTVKSPGEVEIRAADVLVHTGKNAIKLMDIEYQCKRISVTDIAISFKELKVRRLK